MIRDAALRGRTLAAFFLRIEFGLWKDVLASGLLPRADDPAARLEWECLALHACVRGLVGAGGFGADTADAIAALHDSVERAWDQGAPGRPSTRRERLARRYDEYGDLVRQYAARGDEAVIEKIGEAAARALSGTDIANAELGRMLGELHEAIAQGALTSVRDARP